MEVNIHSTIHWESPLPISLYLYSEDFYFSTGMKALCEQQGVVVHTMNKNHFINLSVCAEYENSILFIDTEGMSFEVFEELFDASKLFEHKFIAFDRHSSSVMKECHGCEKEELYISKKINNVSLELILHKKAQPKKVLLTQLESVLLHDLIKGNKPDFVSNSRGVNIKNIYQKRKRILDKCGFDKYTPRNILNSYFLYRMHGS